MKTATNTEKKSVSAIAFALLLTAILAPFIPRLRWSEDQAVIYSIVATILALILGTLSRKHWLGRVARTGALIVLIAGGINYYLFLSMRP